VASLAAGKGKAYRFDNGEPQCPMSRKSP
jgi:hypothetical protein